MAAIGGALGRLAKPVARPAAHWPFLDRRQQQLAPGRREQRVELVVGSGDRLGTAYVAGFALLAAMGNAEAKGLNFTSGPLYDPTVNYERMHGTVAEDTKPEPVATGTTEVPAQTAEVTTPIELSLQR